MLYHAKKGLNLWHLSCHLRTVEAIYFWSMAAPVLTLYLCSWLGLAQNLQVKRWCKTPMDSTRDTHTLRETFLTWCIFLTGWLRPFPATFLSFHSWFSHSFLLCGDTSCPLLPDNPLPNKPMYIPCKWHAVLIGATLCQKESPLTRPYYVHEYRDQHGIPWYFHRYCKR